MTFGADYSSFYSQIATVNKSLANNDLIQIEKAWIAEKGSPHLLPFQAEPIANVIRAVQEQVKL